ncbi:hypothetical protein PTKU46_97940 [Paraburkholderia terrae]
MGSVIALIRDANNPHWWLRGMLDAERLRDSLNLAAIALRDANGFHEVNIGRVQLGGFRFASRQKDSP